MNDILTGSQRIALKRLRRSVFPAADHVAIFI